MEPEKFENKLKGLLEEREIKPSAGSWEQLEQRLEQREKGTNPYLVWLGATAAVAVIFFTLGTFYNSPVPVDTPQMVEEPVESQILEEKKTEPEILQIAASEEKSAEKKSLAEKPSKNAIFETPVGSTSEEESQLATEVSSEAPAAVIPESKALLAEKQSEIAEQKIPSKVSDTEIEALLLLATAELKSDPAFTVDAKDLLHQVEYELDQSFRQKVFEVVKEGISKAKTAVANRDF